MVNVFNLGQYVICGNKGVCVIEQKDTLNISGINKEREYFILKPFYMQNSTVYIPVDSAEASLRPVLTEMEAKKLLKSISQVPLIIIKSEKNLEQEYRTYLKSNCCEDLISIIKTIQHRNIVRSKSGRKETAIDSKYFKVAEENLYGELAVSLGKSRVEVESFVEDELKKVM